MSNEQATALSMEETDNNLTSSQVAEFLVRNPDFFAEHDQLLADLTLPHDSGSAVSLLERQVSILRERGNNTRIKLDSLVRNARLNDQLFAVTRDLVVAMLRARDIGEVVNIAQDRLQILDSIDSCEIILVRRPEIAAADNARQETIEDLESQFADVFRLQHTFCGALNEDQLNYLFPGFSDKIKSTALCPIFINRDVVGLVAIGNTAADYFNINLDTLFLDFIGDVIGALITRFWQDQSSGD